MYVCCEHCLIFKDTLVIISHILTNNEESRFNVCSLSDVVLNVDARHKL